MNTTEERRLARRRWRGDLNHIPVEIAYDFELRLIIANKVEDGFSSSPDRIALAKRELASRSVRDGGDGGPYPTGQRSAS